MVVSIDEFGIFRAWRNSTHIPPLITGYFFSIFKKLKKTQKSVDIPDG
jgi:hypothetical protein